MATPEPRLARIAQLVADPSRARMLATLLGGELASAGELARAGGVSAATASGHLAKLLDGGLVACEPRGRHRWYRLADAEVAHALEALALVAERGPHARSWDHPSRAGLRLARCCYGHLGGRLGVALLDALQAQGWLLARDGGGFGVSDTGAAALDTLGLDGRAWQRRAAAPTARVAYGCLDWSERRDHLAGGLAVALLAQFQARGWLCQAREGRSLDWTPAGRSALPRWLPGVDTLVAAHVDAAAT